MKFDFQMFFLFIAVGLMSRRVTWKGWFALTMLVALWMAYNVWKG